MPYTLEGARELVEGLERAHEAGLATVDVPMLTAIIVQGAWRPRHLSADVLEDIEEEGFALIEYRESVNDNVVLCRLLTTNLVEEFELGVDGWSSLYEGNQDAIDQINAYVQQSRNLAF